MQKIELLSPAGDLECLETALHFGADAVYVGGPKLQLRAANVGFTMETLAGAVLAAHRAGRKLYVTVNSFATNAEIPEIAAYARELYALGVDAAIVADIGVLAEIKKAAPDLPVHVSTQANCGNYAAARVYHTLGASRIVVQDAAGVQIAQYRRERMAPGEMEHIVLPAALLQKAQGALTLHAQEVAQA